MTRSCARLAALLLLFGLVSAGAAPCLCAAAPAAASAADHCGAPAAGVRDAHDGCACPCMTSAADVADRAELEARAAPARLAAPAARHLPQPVLVPTAPRATTGAPERATASPPTVLRI